jgi:hypothetical protein
VSHVHPHIRTTARAIGFAVVGVLVLLAAVVIDAASAHGVTP